MFKTVKGTVVKRLDSSGASSWYQRHSYILIDDDTKQEYTLSYNRNTQDPWMDNLVGHDVTITGRNKNGTIEIASVS